jgi:hypothetical protein
MDFFDNPYTEAHEPSGYDTAQFCLNGTVLLRVQLRAQNLPRSFAALAGRNALHTAQTAGQ